MNKREKGSPSKYIRKDEVESKPTPVLKFKRKIPVQPPDNIKPPKKPKKPRKKYFKLKYFIEQYMVDLDPLKAYQRTGYATGDDDKDKEYIKNIMLKTEMQQVIYENQQEISKRLEITQDRVIKELALLAFSNIKDIANWTGDSMTYKNSDELTRDETAAISEVRFSSTVNTKTVKLKMIDKKAPLIDLGRHLGLFWDDSNKAVDPVDVAQKIRDAVKAIKGKTSIAPPTKED